MTASHAAIQGAVTVTEYPGHTYPAWLTYWHTHGRHKGRARIVLTNGTSRTVQHHQVALNHGAHHDTDPSRMQLEQHPAVVGP